MPSLVTLTLMQMKDKIDFSCFKSFKSALFRIVFAILKFAIITGIIYLALYFVSFLRLTAWEAGIPTSVITIIFSILVGLSIVVCTFGLTKSLYFSTDNQFLLTMPTGRINVFLSKIIVFVIYEYMRNMTYIIPFMLAVGLVNGLGLGFFLWLPFANLILTLFTVSIGALLSIPAVFATSLIRKVKVLEYTLITMLVAGMVLLVLFLIGLIPENLDIVASWPTLFWEIQDILTWVTTNLGLLYGFTTAFFGTRTGMINSFFATSQIMNILLILGITIGIVALTLLVVRPLFFRMASKPFEYTRKPTRRELSNKSHSPFWGSIKKEFLSITRTSEKFNGILVAAIVLPIAILLMNKIFGAMDTRLTGDYMAMAFNILLILLMVLSTNAFASKIFSEEGDSAYLNKTAPARYITVLSTKLIIPGFVMLLSILASVIIFSIYANIGAGNAIILFLSISALYLGHMMSSASLDIMNPQNHIYASTGTHNNNPNETKSTIMAFIISALITFVFLFLINENSASVYFKILFISALYLAWTSYMFVSKIKVYYKEK
ncbi:MAG: hypothetical protein IKC79_00140 [Clostridia bacterium]|nr:hypothetical protein [Clostridia bacterium]